IEAGDVNAINYFVAQKYVEAFAELARNPTAKTVIVPAEMGALVGAIAGIGQLVGLATDQQGARRDGAASAQPAPAPATPRSAPPAPPRPPRPTTPRAG
ncbi:MAG: hypothetical protein KKC14_13065, partial [Alphaproteobacteria bacterium]|nr:hypothetical protein [Alphaproteobacteria bacterium]